MRIPYPALFVMSFLLLIPIAYYFTKIAVKITKAYEATPKKILAFVIISATLWAASDASLLSHSWGLALTILPFIIWIIVFCSEGITYMGRVHSAVPWPIIVISANLSFIVLAYTCWIIFMPSSTTVFSSLSLLVFILVRYLFNTSVRQSFVIWLFLVIAARIASLMMLVIGRLMTSTKI